MNSSNASTHSRLNLWFNNFKVASPNYESFTSTMKKLKSDEKVYVL